MLVQAAFTYITLLKEVPWRSQVHQKLLKTVENGPNMGFMSYLLSVDNALELSTSRAIYSETGLCANIQAEFFILVKLYAVTDGGM